MSNAENPSANRFQEQFGHPSDRARTKVRNYMKPAIQEFIRQAPFAVLATSNLRRLAQGRQTRLCAHCRRAPSIIARRGR